MPTIPNTPNMPGGGWRQQRAAQLRSEAEAEERIQCASAEGQAGLGDDRMHCVQEGESLESIAEHYGQFPDAVWDHPKNDEIRTSGTDARTLVPGEGLYIPAEGDRPLRPAGQGEYIVKRDDCMASIAKKTGHFWETIWNDPANAELREAREDPNVLLPGDRVAIPEKRRKEESRETEQRHRFVRRGQPALLRVRVLQGGKPRANEPYTVKIEGRELSGVTDPEGKLQCTLSGEESKAELLVGSPQTRQRYLLHLGRLEPVESITGVQQRLRNLGFRCCRVDGDLGCETRRGLRTFQERFGLSESGEPDQATCNRLRETHGS